MGIYGYIYLKMIMCIYIYTYVIMYIYIYIYIFMSVCAPVFWFFTQVIYTSSNPTKPYWNPLDPMKSP